VQFTVRTQDVHIGASAIQIREPPLHLFLERDDGRRDIVRRYLSETRKQAFAFGLPPLKQNA